MSFLDLRRALRDRFGWLLVTFQACCLGATIAVLTLPKVYTASSQLYVSTYSASNSSDLAFGADFSQSVVKSFGLLATSQLVLSRASMDLDGVSVSQLAQSVSTSAQVDTSVLTLTAQGPTPEEAVESADAVSAALIATAPSLSPRNDGSSTVKITQIASAQRPLSPSSPRPLLDLGLGVIVGALLGICVAVVRDRLDNKVRHMPSRTVPPFGPLIGSIPFSRELVDQAGHAVDDPRVVESLNSLRANLRFTGFGRSGGRSLVVTSSLPHEGKSVLSLEVAKNFSLAGVSVLLIDADLRVGDLSRKLGLDFAPGLSDVLAGPIMLSDALVPLPGSSVSFCPAGALPPNPAELFESEQLTSLLTQVSEDFQMVILDCAPIVPVADSRSLSSLVDGVIVIVGLGVATRQSVASSRSALALSGAAIVGTVVNLSRDKAGEYGYGRRSRRLRM